MVICFYSLKEAVKVCEWAGDQRLKSGTEVALKRNPHAFGMELETDGTGKFRKFELSTLLHPLEVPAQPQATHTYGNVINADTSDFFLRLGCLRRMNAPGPWSDGLPCLASATLDLSIGRRWPRR